MTKSRLIKAELKEIQKPIVKQLRQKEVSIITGQAGSAKDFLSMYCAIEYILDKGSKYDKIVVTKPIVEIGKSMGFLPGLLEEKVEPYRKSFDDIVNTILGESDTAQVKGLKKKIEFQPINFVRGITFKNSIVILSEFQNCTLHDLISFITRLDSSSKMIINGDLRQSDIGSSQGAKELLKIVDGVEGIQTIELGDEFQMRNKMIVELNNRYCRYIKDKNTF